MDMVQLLYTRLPTFTENQKPLLKKLKMRSLAGDKTKRKSKVFILTFINIHYTVTFLEISQLPTRGHCVFT